MNRWRTATATIALTVNLIATKSVSYPGTGTLMTDYYADGRAVATVAGHLTFVQSAARPLLIGVGLLVFRTVVVDTTPDGLPVIGPPMEILFEAGVDRGGLLAACQAIAP